MSSKATWLVALLACVGAAGCKSSGRTGDTGGPEGGTSQDMSVTNVPDGSTTTTPDGSTTTTTDGGTTTTTDGGTTTTTDGGTTTTTDGSTTTDDDAGSAPAYMFTVSTTAYADGTAYATARHDAVSDLNEPSCACFYEDSDFASASECTTFYNSQPHAISDACWASAYGSADGNTQKLASCIVRVQAQQATCAEAAGCGDAFYDCTEGYFEPTAYDQAIANCFETLSAADNALEALNTSYSSCVSAMSVGTGPDTCGTTPPVSTVGSAVFTGTTTGAGDHRKPEAECFATSPDEDAYAMIVSPDKTLTWQAPATATYTIDTIGSSFDTIVYVIPGMMPALCSTVTPATIACNDDIGSRNYQSSVSVPLTMGQTILIVVDGFNDIASGDFVVNINQE